MIREGHTWLVLNTERKGLQLLQLQQAIYETQTQPNWVASDLTWPCIKGSTTHHTSGSLPQPINTISRERGHKRPRPCRSGSQRLQKYYRWQGRRAKSFA